jgi:NAD(P)H-flavin reductase
MLRLAGCNDPLLGRPLALYDTVIAADGEPIGIDVVYLVVGKLTRRLAELGAGAALEVWGPLGNGFELAPTEHLVMVAGGIGQTPFPAVAQAYLERRLYGAWSGADRTSNIRRPTSNLERQPGACDPPHFDVGRSMLDVRCSEPTEARPKPPSRVPGEERAKNATISQAQKPAPPRRITLCYGARSADYLAGLDDFRRLGVDLRVSTDDGSAGHHGLVTDVLRQVLENAECGIRNAPLGTLPEGVWSSNSEFRIPNSELHILCCGPEPMMEAVAELAHAYGVGCQASLESPMACGIGICFSCVARVRQADGTWDYRRTCVEGPVFDAQQIVW